MRSRNSVPVYTVIWCLLYVHLRVSGVMLAVTLRASGARRPSVRGRICIVWEKRVFCLAYIQRRLFVFVLLCFTHSHKRGTSGNVRGNISVSCLCVLRDRASRSPASVSVEASLPWLLFRYSCTSRDTRDVSMWWCHTAVSLQTTQPCLCHHSFVRPGGLYPCLENANSKAVPVRQKP